MNSSKSRVRKTRFGTPLVSAAVAFLSFGCSTSVRFKDQPIVWQVDDTRSIDEPEEREFLKYQYYSDLFALRRSERALRLDDKEPAHNTNALDEVPNSAWFSNRIGMRDVSPEEAGRGPAKEGPPKLPLRIISGKSGGGNPGFVAEDQSGRGFVVKFDTPENPEMQTGGNMIVNRIFWTLGFNVPADYVFHFSRGDVTIDPKATFKNALLDKEPYTEKQLAEALANVYRLPDGKFRATASQFLDGVPKGGFAMEGTRDDDPNDVVPHEHRRELRGLRVFSAWVNHTDLKEDNTLSMYVEKDGRKFLRHYLVDFGEALGGHAAEKGRLEDGYENFWDWQAQPLATITFGLHKRDWENQKTTQWLAIGPFTADNFEPAEWKVAYPFWPFFEMDAADAYWGAKLVMRFTRPMVKAIVDEAQFTEPGATEYMVETLLQRRDLIGRRFLEAVSPLDHFTISKTKLCGIDLSIAHGLKTQGEVVRVSADGRTIDRARPKPDGTFCIGLPPASDYQILRLRVRRGGEFKPPVKIHWRGDGTPRILGIVRDG